MQNAEGPSTTLEEELADVDLSDEELEELEQQLAGSSLG